MKPITAALLLMVLCAPLFAQSAAPSPDDGKPHKFSLHDHQFFVDDVPIRLFAGEIHPARIPPEFWDDRIKKAKAMGLNAISVYLFWNEIEPAEGQFNFTGNSDIRRFVKLCQDNGMWMIVRAGPYCCAEWEFGGFPGWLLKHKGIGLRSAEPQFMEFSRRYVEKVHEQIGDLQVTHGGPILLVQFENEFHRMDAYLRAVHDIFVNAGFDTQLMTCDPGAPNAPPWSDINGGIPGVLRGYNGFTSGTESRYQQSVKINAASGYPVLSPEVYTGWFNTWGPVRKAPRVAIDRQLQDTRWLLDHKNLSWTYYVFDGGTNFGFMAGANHGIPMQTSYDYDAPVDELGRITPKYRALRDLFIQTLKVKLPPIPADPGVIEIPAFSLTADQPLLARLPEKSIQSDNVVTMESLDQNYGFIDYRKTFDGGLGKGTLQLKGARDYSIVMINGKVVGEAFDGYGPGSYTMEVDEAGNGCTLDILVHNLGRDSLLPEPRVLQTKGLNENPTLNGTPLTGWTIFSLPLDDPGRLVTTAAASAKTGENAVPTGPTFYKGTFNLNDLGETYLDMRLWHLGVVWVNGHNLGRYWDVGDGRCIYLPSVWQKKGENQITVLELGTPPSKAEIKGVTNMILTKATRFKPFWTGH